MRLQSKWGNYFLLTLSVLVLTSCAPNKLKSEFTLSEVNDSLRDFSVIRFEQNLFAATPMSNRKIISQIASTRTLSTPHLLKAIKEQKPEIYKRLF